MQYGRVACDGVTCVSYIHAAPLPHMWEIGGRSKSESAVYSSSVGTGVGPD